MLHSCRRASCAGELPAVTNQKGDPVRQLSLGVSFAAVVGVVGAMGVSAPAAVVNLTAPGSSGTVTGSVGGTAIFQQSRASGQRRGRVSCGCSARAQSRGTTRRGAPPRLMN